LRIFIEKKSFNFSEAKFHSKYSGLSWVKLTSPIVATRIPAKGGDLRRYLETYCFFQALPLGYAEREDIAARFPVPVIEWNTKRSLSFKNWHQLRLRLPPRSSKHSGGAASGPKASANTVCSVAISRARGADCGSTVVTSVVDRAANCGKRRSNSSFLEKNDSLEILV